MNMNVPTTTMSLVLEVVMFDVFEAVTHFRLAATKRLAPQNNTLALDLHCNRQRFKIGVNDQFGSQRTGAQFGACKVEIVLLFKLVIGELVARSQADAIRMPVGCDQVHSGNLGLLAAILGITGYVQRFSVGAQRASRSL